MKKILTVFVLVVALILNVSTVSFASSTMEFENTNDIKVKKVHQVKKNLENPNLEAEKIVKDVLKGKLDTKGKKYKISKESTLKKQFDALNLAAANYNEDATELIKSTDPTILLKYVENQCERAAQALETLEGQKADYVYNDEDEDGNINIMEVYDLGEGTEIIVQGLDEKDDSQIVKGNEIFSPCEIVTKTWVTDKNLYKDRGDRRYTAIYSIKVGSTVQGKITVSNHYTVNKADLTMRNADIWEYLGNGPLTIERDGSAWTSSKTKATKADDEIYAGARFYVTCSRSTTTTVEGSVSPGGVGIAEGVSVTWNANDTRLHKIYAAVVLNKFTSSGAYVKNWGKVTYSK